MIAAAGLTLAAALSATSPVRPASIAEVLERVCIPYALDGVAAEAVARRTRLHPVLEFVDPFGSPRHDGRGFEGASVVGVLRLNEEQVILLPGILSRRSCSFTLHETRPDLDEQLRSFVARSPARFAPDQRYDRLTRPGPDTQLFCARERAGAWLVRSTYAGRVTVALGIAPPSSTLCGATPS